MGSQCSCTAAATLCVCNTPVGADEYTR
jgi:hypothetical protein